jgi:3-(3-hydroxy-phenyl)propionate hydroxylase
LLAAPGSEFDGWLRKGRASAAIVRPDRAVMQAGHSVEAICRAVPEFDGVESTNEHVGHRSM